MALRRGDVKGRFRKGQFGRAFESLFKDIASKSADIRILKDGASTTVGVMRGQGFSLPFDLVIKRFKYKGALHSMAKRVAGSRARLLYRVNLKLFENDLKVPCPVGFMEGFKDSFYCSEYIEGSDNLAAMYENGFFGEPRKFAGDLARALSAWHLKGAVHGDLKWTNILVRKTRCSVPGSGGEWDFFFIDLDQAVLNKEWSARGAEKDLERFYSHALRFGAGSWVAEEFFPAYLKELPPPFIGKLDISMIIEGAERKERSRAR